LSTLEIGSILLVVLGVLLAGGVWIAIALGMVAWVGMYFFTSSPPGLSLVTSMWSSSDSWTLSALPMFIWMGEILFRTRLSGQIFSGLAPWLEWLPGKLMHVNVIGCGIFGSVSGSSAATCATIARVALPELKKRGYDEKMALGSLCGSGTLGLLIPPSIIMVVYAVAADVSILRVFIAGIMPGFLLMALFSGAIVAWALLNPDKTPPAQLRMPMLERIKATGYLIPCMLLIVFVVFMLLGGFATPTEAAALGVLGSLVLAALDGSLTLRAFWDSVMGATRLTCMIMFILAASSFLTVTMGFTGVPRALAELVGSMHLSPYALIGILCIVYIILGAALDGVSMIVLTTSIVLPMVQQAGFDLVWFGIFIVLLVEIAEVTPPVGFNLFVLQAMSGKSSLFVAQASIPFFFMMVLACVLITVFPAIVTWLPDALMNK
jgi:tripartite ATP-independent transporter DctM subunit